MPTSLQKVIALGIVAVFWQLFLVGWQLWHIQGLNEYPAILEPVYGIFNKGQVKGLARDKLWSPLLLNGLDLIALMLTLFWIERGKREALKQRSVEGLGQISLGMVVLYYLSTRLLAMLCFGDRSLLSIFRDTASLGIPAVLTMVHWAARKQSAFKPTLLLLLSALLATLTLLSLPPLLVWLFASGHSHRSLPRSYFEPISHLLHTEGFSWHHLYYLHDDNDGEGEGLFWAPNIVSLIGPYLVVPAGSDGWWGGLPQLVAILAHELGHWQAGDNHLIVFLSCVYALALTMLLDRALVPRLQSDYGRLGAFLLGSFTLANVHSLLIAPLWHGLRWQMEMAADLHAVNLGYASELAYALSWAEIRCEDHGLVSKLWALWHHHHPPYALRIAHFT